MRNRKAIAVGAVLAVLLLWNMFTFEVSEGQMAVVTTFGKAGEQSVRNGDAQGAGRYFKWPPPIQSVKFYDARVQALEDRLEEQQTLDRQNVVVGAFAFWRIQQPLEFYRSLGDAEEAEKQLRARLRDARAEIGRFTFDELTHPDPARLKLAQAEESILKKLQADADAQKYGVRIESVGIKRLVLPEPVTRKVFDSMRATRETLAQQARSEGDAAAEAIKSKAKSDAERILAFAKRRAEAIRAEGDQASAEYYATFKQDESFAIFLRQIEALKSTLKHNTTFVLDSKIAPFGLLEEAKSGATPKN